MAAIGDIARIVMPAPHGPAESQPGLLGLIQDAIVADERARRAAKRQSEAQWRALERKLSDWRSFERMVSERPGPSKRTSRRWDERQRVTFQSFNRMTHGAPADFLLTRDVGPHDGIGMRLWSGHTIHW